MKILSWNCNMALRNKVFIFDYFKPDIAIIQECESEEVLIAKKSKIKYDNYVWIGDNKNKGLGIMAFNGFELSLLDCNKDFKYILPVRAVKEDIDVNIIGVWTQMINNDLYQSYVVQAHKAFIYYEHIFNKDNVLVAGDFNSNSIWDNDAPKEFNHSQMVEFLESKNMKSVYHEARNEQMGRETIPTLYFTKQVNKPYHVDYLFLKRIRLKQIQKFAIGEYNKFIKYSDHMPLFLEINNY